jgi:hypothetical protein
VIVIPEHAGATGVRVLVASCLSWRDHVCGKPVRLRARRAAVKVHDRRNGKVIGVRDECRSPATGSNRGSRETSVVSPDSRSHAGKNFGIGLALTDLVIVARRIDRTGDKTGGMGSGTRNLGTWETDSVCPCWRIVGAIIAADACVRN